MNTTDQYEQKFLKMFPHFAYSPKKDLHTFFAWFYSNPPPESYYYLQMEDEEYGKHEIGPGKIGWDPPNPFAESGVPIWTRKT
jgi:hypothetical protein